MVCCLLFNSLILKMFTNTKQCKQSYFHTYSFLLYYKSCQYIIKHDEMMLHDKYIIK